MKRIDTIYIDTTGSVQKVTGTMAANPVKPALLVGSIRIADVLVDEGATTGDIQDSRALLTTADKNILISPNVGQINNIVFLSRYESITEAIADIDNKVLVIDVDVNESNEILIDTHSNFVICSDLSKNIDASLKFVDCSNFRINNLKISGTNNYKTFYIFSSNNFIIDGLFIDGTQSRQHEGLHIFACLDFKVINNTVQFSALDSILIHSECYNFVVSNNIVKAGGAIGIEIEGRTDGSQTDPQYSRCHHGTISNNVIDAEWNAILCLFSDDINIVGNNCKNSINIAGSTNVIVTGNTTKYRGYGLQVGVELFTFDKAGNYCKNITVTGNSFYGTTGVLAGNYYGWDGIVTVRGVENFIFTSNVVMFVGSSGIDNKVSYLSLFDVDFATITDNIMEPTDHGYIPYFGIKLVDRTTEYATQATIKKGLYNIKIKDNVVRHAYWGIGVDVYNCLSASDKASNFYNIDIDNNTLYNCTQIALTLMLIDNSCYIKLGKNAIHSSNEAVNTYLSEARLTSNSYQDINSCQSSMDIPISQTALYEPGDTIYNPSTTVTYQVCVASGTPGTWKSVALS